MHVRKRQCVKGCADVQRSSTRRLHTVYVYVRQFPYRTYTLRPYSSIFATSDLNEDFKVSIKRSGLEVSKTIILDVLRYFIEKSCVFR